MFGRRRSLPPRALLVLDQRQSWDTEIELVVDRGVHGVLRHAGQAVDLRSIRGVYLRPYEAPRLDLTTRDEVRARRVALNEALLAWSEVTPARVLNRPSAMASVTAQIVERSAEPS